MKPWIWLRALAILLAVFAVGHTLGTAAPKVTRGPGEAVVFAAMQDFRFPVMGSSAPTGNSIVGSRSLSACSCC